MNTSTSSVTCTGVTHQSYTDLDLDPNHNPNPKDVLICVTHCYETEDRSKEEPLVVEIN